MAERLSKKFVGFLLRELGADSARLLTAEDEPEKGSLVADLGDGHRVEVKFATPPKGPKVAARRLGMLVSAFGGAAVEKGREKAQDPRSQLSRELAGVVKRSDAFDAVVIDAQSPIVWAAVRNEERDRLGKRLRDRAITFARELGQMEALSRGGHLAASHRTDDFGVVIRGMAGIYALVLVFDHAFDEIRAERALKTSLSRIERLVLALPPIEPEPTPAGVVALRRRRR